MAEAGGPTTVVHELSARFDAARVAEVLAAVCVRERLAGWCWLDGSQPAAGERAISYLGIADEVLMAQRGHESAFLEQLQPSVRPQQADTGFTGGWVTALGYEFGVALLELPPAADDAAPGFALRLDVVLAIDHANGRAELRSSDEAKLDAWISRFGAELEAVSNASCTDHRSAEVATPRAPAEAGWRSTEADFLSGVESCRASIHDGDAYVLCLTDTAEVASEVDPLDLFLRLRAGGSAVRGGVIVAGQRALVSMSPERFLSVRGGRIATHPIKGTRPRHSDPVQDQALAASLAADPKECAENLMIVDLMRNDLSRVCAPGSIAVEGFLRVESHAHVHQLVSTVTGELRAGVLVTDAIRRCFPGGSMTGAPKRSAVTILGGIEEGPRGLYSGCFGWIADGGDAELAMTIRGVELRRSANGAQRALVGAGSGLTADSAAQRELAETRLKAASLLRELGPRNDGQSALR